MYKVGVIGDMDSIMGFLAIGIDIFPAYEAQEIKRTIINLAEQNYGIIYITEKASLLAGDIIDRYNDSQLPAIIIIPGIGQNLGIGMTNIRESSKRAIGADILFNE